MKTNNMFVSLAVIPAIAFILISCFFSQAAGQEKKNRVLLLGFHNKSDISSYPASGDFSSIMLNSLYSFIGYIPVLDIPDRETLRTINWDSTDIPGTADEMGADIVVSGEYVQTERNKLAISLSIWSREKNTSVYTNIYLTGTDISMFDTLDIMTSDIIQNILQVSLEYAYINFTGFHTEGYPCGIFINDKLVDTVTNDDYYLRFKVLPSTAYGIKIQAGGNGRIYYSNDIILSAYQETNISFTPPPSVILFTNLSVGSDLHSIYIDDFLAFTAGSNDFSTDITLPYNKPHTVVVQRDWDHTPVYSTTLNMDPGETNFISYRGSASVNIGKIRNRERYKKYSMLLMDTNVSENQAVSGIQSGETYAFTVNDGNKTLYSESFYLRDGSKYAIKPVVPWAGPLHFRIYSEDSFTTGVSSLSDPDLLINGTSGSIGCDYFFSRYSWAGISLSYPVNINNVYSNIFNIFPSLDLGNFFINDMSYPLRIGGGLSLRVDSTSDESFGNNTYIRSGIFFDADIYNITLRAGTYFDLNDFSSSPELDLKIGLVF